MLAFWMHIHGTSSSACAIKKNFNVTLQSFINDIIIINSILKIVYISITAIDWGFICGTLLRFSPRCIEKFKEMHDQWWDCHWDRL